MTRLSGERQEMKDERDQYIDPAGFSIKVFYKRLKKEMRETHREMGEYFVNAALGSRFIGAVVI